MNSHLHLRRHREGPDQTSRCRCTGDSPLAYSLKIPPAKNLALRCTQACTDGSIMEELGISYHKMRHITLLGGVALNMIIHLVSVIEKPPLSLTINSVRKRTIVLKLLTESLKN